MKLHLSAELKTCVPFTRMVTMTTEVTLYGDQYLIFCYYRAFSEEGIVALKINTGVVLL